MLDLPSPPASQDPLPQGERGSPCISSTFFPDTTARKRGSRLDSRFRGNDGRLGAARSDEYDCLTGPALHSVHQRNRIAFKIRYKVLKLLNTRGFGLTAPLLQGIQ